MGSASIVSICIGPSEVKFGKCCENNAVLKIKDIKIIQSYVKVLFVLTVNLPIK